MGGLYNVVFGRNPNADFILQALGLKRIDFGRFRDANVCRGEIAVYTRIGGDNREAYPEVFARMAAHPLFLKERNDTFDNTYCTFFFKVPEPWLEQMQTWDLGTVWDSDVRWKEGIKGLNENPQELTERMNQYLVVRQPGKPDEKGGDFFRKVTED